MSWRYSSLEIRRLHGAVHWSIEASRQGRNQRHRSSLFVDVQRAGAELEDLLQHLHRAAQAAGAGERPVELRAPLVRLAGELDAGKILAGGDLQVRKRLVVLQVLVVLGLDVLDQPGFDQQGVDLALGLEEVDVADLADQVGRAAILGGGLEKVAAGPRARRFLALPT